MDKQASTLKTKHKPKAQNLTPNEKAIIESIPVPLLRSLFTRIWKVKIRLQFTGWLQYIPPALVSLLALLLAGIARWLGSRLIALVFALVGGFLFAWVVFDLVTVKFKLRLPEPLPRRNDDLGLFDLMRARHSCRSFQTRKLTSPDFQELMDSVQRHSAQPGIGNSPVRFEYISAPLTVWPTVNATEFLVAIAPLEYDRLAVIDVGYRLQKIVIDATRMGLGTCWIGPGADHQSIKQRLGDRFDPLKDHIICVCAVGYQSRYIPLFIRIFTAQFGRRLPLSKLFFTDPEFKVPLDPESPPFDRFGRNFEICQWAPSSYNGQTTRCVAVMEESGKDQEPRLERFDFYAVTASRYYAPVALGIWCANWELGCQAQQIQGRFAVLSTVEREIHGRQDNTQLPRYDVSWVPKLRATDQLRLAQDNPAGSGEGIDSDQ
ncbi:MAG: nitroreductase family protein [Anaerolineales bacterium]